MKIFTIQEWYKLEQSIKDAYIRLHFNKWCINHDSRQDNFERNVQRWKEIYGWSLSPTFVRELNDKMRSDAGRLWNYSGD